MNWFLRNWDQVAVALGEHLVDRRLGARDRASRFRSPSASPRRAASACSTRRSAVSGILYTVPTLAFLALLIPLVGLGKTNAIICMVAFSLMILIRNIADRHPRGPRAK